MASKTPKKSTASKSKKTTGSKKSSTSSRSKTGTSRSTSGRGRKPAPKQPVRREVGGIILLMLTLFVTVSYFGVHALVLDGLSELLRGLLGTGYWVSAPVMLLCGLILLFHRGRPVALRVTCSALIPLFTGSLFFLLFHVDNGMDFHAVLRGLWTDGGVLTGVLAIGMEKALSEIVSIILLMGLIVGCIMVALQITLGTLVEHHRNRIPYEEQPAIHVVERDAQPRPQIDFPLDIPSKPEPEAVPQPKRENRFTGFFRHKASGLRTPDQVVESIPVEKQPAIPNGSEPVGKTPVAMPVIEPVQPERPLRSPVPAMAQGPASVAQPEEQPLPSSRKEKAKTAREVAVQTAAVTAEIEGKLAQEENTYQYPPVDLLTQNTHDNRIEVGAELRNNSRRLADTLTSFGVDATPSEVVHGPAVTRYEFVLGEGVKLSKITNLADDIALALGATGVRIAPIPDKISVVGIEVPNKQVTPVLIRDVIDSREFTGHKSNVAFALGRDIGGRNIIGNIEKLPHVLIAGTTGSGKSVCTNSLIVSLLYRSTPDEVRFIMVDPKMVELAPYNGIPHLLIPVVTDPKKAAGALQWAVYEMMKRYKTFSECGVKKLEEYNKLARASQASDDGEKRDTMPAVVVVIDELADLMLVAAKEVEESICRVAQMGRAAGVHLVIATQRPSADVITGLMKANIPSRIAFAVASSLESRIILDTTGAEKLVGKGDMLYAPLGAGKPTRVQGCFISPEEIEKVVEFVKQGGEPQYSQEVIDKIDTFQEKDKGSKGGSSGNQNADADEGDELLPDAVEVVLETGQASVSMLQRRLKLGYSRAARLVDQMEERGIVGPFEGSKPRQLLITRAQWQEMQMGGGESASAVEADLEQESITL